MNRVLKPLFGLLAAALWCGPSFAAMYKCTDASGTVSYQQLPCPGRPADESLLEVKEQPKLGTGTPEDALPKPKPAAAEPAPNANGVAQEPAPAAGPEQEMVECTLPNGKTIRVPADLGCRPQRALAGPEDRSGPGGQRPGPAGGPLRRGRVMSGSRGPATETENWDGAPASSNRQQTCEEARAEGERRRRENMSLSFDERSRLDAQVRAACD